MFFPLTAYSGPWYHVCPDAVRKDSAIQQPPQEDVRSIPADKKKFLEYTDHQRAVRL